MRLIKLTLLHMRFVKIEMVFVNDCEKIELI